jgi:predicted MarR family transcription regulator
LGLVKKAKKGQSSSKKSLSYQITEKGIQNTDAYTEARKNILIQMFKDFEPETLKLDDATKTLSNLKGIYDEASRIAASYRKSE